MSVMNTVTHSSTELSISVSRLVRKYKLDICISDRNLDEDKSSPEISIASLFNPIVAESRDSGSVIDPEPVKEVLEEVIPSSESNHTVLSETIEITSMESESSEDSDPVKDDGLEYYGPNVITALFPLGELARFEDKQFFKPICQYYESWGKILPESEIYGYDIGVAVRCSAGKPVFNWYCSLIDVIGLTQGPTPLHSAKSVSLLKACDVSSHTANTASSKCDFLVIYYRKPDTEVEAQIKQQLVVWLGWDPEISPWEIRPIRATNSN